MAADFRSGVASLRRTDTERAGLGVRDIHRIMRMLGRLLKQSQTENKTSEAAAEANYGFGSI